MVRARDARVHDACIHERLDHVARSPSTLMTRPPPSALLRTEKQAFYDYSNRTIILRGANLACKQPLGQRSSSLFPIFNPCSHSSSSLSTASHDATFHLDLPSSPSTAGRISFVGSPLKLKGVQVHIERLKSYVFRLSTRVQNADHRVSL